MFWRKTNAVADSETALYALAAQLGMEKRFSPRVAYPPGVEAGLPRFSFGDHVFAVHDLSIGGCSLLDPGQIFGAQIGLDSKLTIDWGQEREVITARLVGRVDHRRNFQFLDLPPARAERIKNLIAPGVRGGGLSLVRDPGLRGPVLDAVEVWTSAGGDSVTIESDLQRLASVYLSGQMTLVMRAAWPVDERERPVSGADLDQLILFLSNAPGRTPALGEVLRTLVDLSRGPRP